MKLKYLEVAAGGVLFALAMWFMATVAGIAEGMMLPGSVAR